MPEIIGQYIRGGAPMVGEVPASGLFSDRATRPSKTVAEVLKASRWSKPVLKATVKPHANHEVDVEVFKRTMEEVNEGKADGPFTEEQVDNLLGKWWPPFEESRPSPVEWD